MIVFIYTSDNKVAEKNKRRNSFTITTINKIDGINLTLNFYAKIYKILVKRSQRHR